MALRKGEGPATDRTVNEARKGATDNAPSKPQSWRDWLPIHPAAELFPPMSRDELKALGEDIKKNGLRSRVAVMKGPPQRPAGGAPARRAEAGTCAGNAAPAPP